MATAAESGTAYVVETCAPKVACPGNGGFVQVLGGPTIAAGLDDPAAIAFDASGNAYVANAQSTQTGFVTVYAPGKVAPLRTIHGVTGSPHWLAFDASNDLYVVGNYRYQCCQIRGAAAIYKADSTTLLRRLKNVGSFPGSPVFDAKGNLYLANFDDFPGWVAVYAPGARTPSRIIQKGIGFPTSMAFDPSGNLYVLNIVFDNSFDIAVYAPGSSTPSRTITRGLSKCRAIAIDSKGNLYVANPNKKSGNVVVYAPGSSSVTRTISIGIADPIALALDASGNLYVANSPAKGVNTVTVYAQGASSPKHTYRVQQELTALAISR
jgi:DNA-binding beta-propeller fold protein YncE